MDQNSSFFELFWIFPKFRYLLRITKRALDFARFASKLKFVDKTWLQIIPLFCQSAKLYIWEIKYNLYTQSQNWNNEIFYSHCELRFVEQNLINNNFFNVQVLLIGLLSVGFTAGAYGKAYTSIYNKVPTNSLNKNVQESNDRERERERVQSRFQ